MKALVSVATVAIVALAACKDEKVTTGEAYGFRVGRTKQEAFDAYLAGRRQGRFESLEPVPMQEEAKEKFPWIVRALNPSEVEAVFSGWEHWDLTIRGKIECLMGFEAGVLKSLARPNAGPRDQMILEGGLVLTPGQTYQEVLALLVALEKALGREAVFLGTGWMAARPPDGNVEEQFWLMSPWDHWRIDVEGFPESNVIYLEFDDAGLLLEIIRHMHPMSK